MARKKFASEPVKDEFFDDPPEKYWARIKVEQNHQSFCTIDIPPNFQCNCDKYRFQNNIDPRRADKILKISPLREEVDLPLSAEATAKQLNKILVPLAEMRMRIAELQGSGVKKMPLVDFLKLVQEVYREHKDE